VSFKQGEMHTKFWLENIDEAYLRDQDEDGRQCYVNYLKMSY